MCFQASALDPAGPVTMTIDLGSSHKLESLNIDWEFPAKSFAVGLSLDGVRCSCLCMSCYSILWKIVIRVKRWTEAFATDSNVLASTSISLGSARASKVRVIMHEVIRIYKHIPVFCKDSYVMC